MPVVAWDLRVEHLRLHDMMSNAEAGTALQELTRCRDEVCTALELQPEDLELSMGMSGDFEQAVSGCSSGATACLTCQVRAATVP